MDRRVYRTLTKEMQISSRAISRLFKKFLSHAPKIPIKSKTQVHLLAANIVLAKAKQKEIDIKRNKIVAANIKYAQLKSDEAGKSQRSQIGKELNDNLNQL